MASKSNLFGYIYIELSKSSTMALLDNLSELPPPKKFHRTARELFEVGCHKNNVNKRKNENGLGFRQLNDHEHDELHWNS